MRDSPTSEWFIFFVCSSVYAFIAMAEDHFLLIQIGCDATVEYCDHCYQALLPTFLYLVLAQVAFFTHL